MSVLTQNNSTAMVRLPPLKTAQSVTSTSTASRSPEEFVNPPKYEGVPRRYEQTKPARLQYATHQTIITIGTNLHKHMRQDADTDKSDAVKQAEENVWSLAEKQKDEAIEKLRQYAAADRENAIKSMKATHEKALKEEALRVESMMQKWTMEQVREEKEHSEKKLAEELENERKQFSSQLEDAVENARIEEREAAQIEHDRIMRETQDKANQLAQRSEQEKQNSMVNLRSILQKEKNSAVAAMKIKEQQIATSQLAEIITEQAEKLAFEEIVINNKRLEIERLEKELASCKEENEVLRYELSSARLEFQHFIGVCNTKFYPGQDEYLLKEGTD